MSVAVVAVVDGVDCVAAGVVVADDDDVVGVGVVIVGGVADVASSRCCSCCRY